MIEISERDYLDLLFLILKTKDADLLEFFLDLLSEPLNIHLLDDEWHDVRTTGDEMLKLEAILYERGLLSNPLDKDGVLK